MAAGARVARQRAWRHAGRGWEHRCGRAVPVRLICDRRSRRSRMRSFHVVDGRSRHHRMAVARRAPQVRPRCLLALLRTLRPQASRPGCRALVDRRCSHRGWPSALRWRGSGARRRAFGGGRARPGADAAVRRTRRRLRNRADEALAGTRRANARRPARARRERASPGDGMLRIAMRRQPFGAEWSDCASSRPLAGARHAQTRRSTSESRRKFEWRLRARPHTVAAAVPPFEGDEIEPSAARHALSRPWGRPTDEPALESVSAALIALRAGFSGAGRGAIRA